MIEWVYGNTLPLVVKLQEVIKTQEGTTKQDYVPPTGSEIEVWVINSYANAKKQYDFTLEGNILMFQDDGTLGVGTYGIQVLVREPESRNLRSFKCEEIKIVRCTKDLDLGEFIGDDAVVLDTMPFFWAKGEKGDKGDKGDAGTTDYNELENKPDLSVYMEEITQEDFYELFTLN